MRGVVQRLFREETVLSTLVLVMAGISPLIFPAAQAGVATMAWLAQWFLMPSLAILLAVFIFGAVRAQRRLINRMVAGVAAGLISTFLLDLVRLTGFHLGWMPGDLAMLLGVLLTDRFMSGPSTLSTMLGYAYHYWNGAAFGMVFAVLLGRKPLGWGVAYGLLIGTIFLMSPAVQALGVGFMGREMPTMPITVTLAHLVFGASLGVLCQKWVREPGWLLAPVQRSAVSCHCCSAPCVGRVSS